MLLDRTEIIHAKQMTILQVITIDRFVACVSMLINDDK
jgi:hypothetical protein